MKKFYLLIAFLVTISTLCLANTIHVPAEKPTIQAGINTAVNGDVVLVAPGTYEENISFLGKAITVTSSGGAESTIIDGGHSPLPDYGSVVTFSQGEGVDSVLDGFQLTGGTGTYYLYYPGIWCYCGGGIFCINYSSPTIRNTTVIGNTVSHDGGGIFCYESSPTITDSTIIGNTSDSWGGGIYCYSHSSPSITNTTINGNTASAQDGGGILCGISSSPIITDSNIFGNTAGGQGGGIFCNSGSSPTISTTAIFENTADDGGGIFCADCSPTITDTMIFENTANFLGGGGICCYSGSSPSIMNTMIFGNTAKQGGGIECYNTATPTITNTAVFGNSAGGKGGGIFCWSASTPIISNATIIGNTAGNWGGGLCSDWLGSPTLTDSILWDNTAPAGSQIYVGSLDLFSTVTISYSDVEGGQAAVHVDPGCTLNWGDGMIDANPLFAAGSDGCQYLRQIAAGQASDSPCVDAGGDLASSLGMDTLWTRTDGVGDTGTVDMGFHYGAFSFPWTSALYPDAYTIPETTGGSVNFHLDAGAEKANRKYILLGSASGTEPGFALPGGQATLPLNFDIFTLNTVIPLINTYIFSNFLGTLDANGRATAQLNLPAVTGYAGVKTYFAFCLGWPWEFASNPVEVEIVP